MVRISNMRMRSKGHEFDYRVIGNTRVTKWSLSTYVLNSLDWEISNPSKLQLGHDPLYISPIF